MHTSKNMKKTIWLYINFENTYSNTIDNIKLLIQILDQWKSH